MKDKTKQRVKKFLLYTAFITALLFLILLPKPQMNGSTTPTPLPSATNDRNYIFEETVLLDSDNLNSTGSTNFRNQTTYTEIYNGSYSFTTDIGFTVVAGAGCYANVTASEDGHNNVVKLYDNGGATQVYMYDNSGVAQTSGTIEFWIKTSDITKEITVQGANTGWSAVGFYFTIRASKFQYEGVGWTDIPNVDQPPVNDVWYHVKIEFDCVAEEIIYWVNGISSGVVVMSDTNANDIDYIIFRTLNTDSGYYGYIDAVGYSWYDNYSIGDNIIPYHYQTSEVEIDTWSFKYTEAGVYAESQDLVPFWTEINGDESVSNGDVNIYNEVAGNRGIYKDDFNIEDGFLNVSILLNFEQINTDGTYQYIELYSYDTTLIVRLRAHTYNYGVNSRTFLSFYDGSSYNNITELFDDTDYYLNLFIDNIITLRNETEILEQFPIIAYKNGLSEVKYYNTCPNGDGAGMNWYLEMNIKNIGVYLNGSSLSEDWLHRSLNTNLHWDSNHNHLFYCNLTGYVKSLTISSETSITGATSYTDITNYSAGIRRNTYGLFSGGDEASGWQSYPNVNITVVSNTTIIFNEIKISGIKMTYSSESIVPYMETGYLNTDDNFFWVENNELHYFIESNDSNTEYMLISFDMNDISLYNKTFLYKSQLSGVFAGEIRVNYLDATTSIIEVKQGFRSEKVGLPISKTLISVAFLITDNDKYTEANATGYFTDIILRAQTDYEISIITTNILDALTPLLFFIIFPSFLIALYLRTPHQSEDLTKKVMTPLLFIFSLVAFGMGALPLWMLFLIIIGFLGLLIMSSDDGGTV